MKNFLIILGFVTFSLGLSAQPAPIVNPCNGSQQFYVDRSGHTVPYVVARPNNGVVTLVFDPSTSTTDINNAFANYLKNGGGGGLAGGVPTYVVLPNYVATGFNQQITRVVVPFSTNTNTTLLTIPFSVGTTLQTNGHYRFIANLYTNTGAGGTKIDVGGTCNTSNFVAEYQAFSTTTILYGGQLTSFLSGPGGSSTAGTTLVTIQGELDVTNGGTFVIQFAQNASNATNSTVLAGSNLTITQIP